ncbi:unnamed protein product [Dovyalis caffra]|uniref:Uncharacterized protein n=1 Tax=Dovyalis caffra TaxID=77055 RepID=A0AAV1SAR8_9ROSI|nr:unnamed protein product [Dovyalis caffra]
MSQERGSSFFVSASQLVLKAKVGDHKYNLAKNAREGSTRRITNKSEEKDKFERTRAVPFTPGLVKISAFWMELRNGEGRMRQMR